VTDTPGPSVKKGRTNRSVWAVTKWCVPAVTRQSSDGLGAIPSRRM